MAAAAAPSCHAWHESITQPAFQTACVPSLRAKSVGFTFTSRAGGSLGWLPTFATSTATDSGAHARDCTKCGGEQPEVHRRGKEAKLADLSPFFVTCICVCLHHRIALAGRGECNLLCDVKWVCVDNEELNGLLENVCQW